MRIVKNMEEQNIIESVLEQKNDFVFFETDFRQCFCPELVSIINSDGVSEIMINGTHSVYFEKNGVLYPSDCTVTEVQLQRFLDVVARLNSRNIDINHPIFDGRLPGGFRCNVVLPPVSMLGAVITIRKHSGLISSMEQLKTLGMLDEHKAKLLLTAMENKANIIVAGGTGTGKTTLLNVLFNSISDAGSQRVLSIEDTAELKIELPHIISMEVRYATPDCPLEVGIRELVRTALRMRPDRIVIGEVRGEEAYDLLHAINTGHKGTVCTIHANSCRDALRRLETLAILGHPNLDILVPRTWIASNINLVVYVERLGNSRVVTEIKSIEGVEAGNYVLSDLL